MKAYVYDGRRKNRPSDQERLMLEELGYEVHNIRDQRASLQGRPFEIVVYGLGAWVALDEKGLLARFGPPSDAGTVVFFRDSPKGLIRGILEPKRFLEKFFTGMGVPRGVMYNNRTGNFWYKQIGP